MPDCLTNCLPITDAADGSSSKNYLYQIQIRHLDTPLGRLLREHGKKVTHAAYRHVEFRPEQEPRGFGILTSKPIPSVSFRFTSNARVWPALTLLRLFFCRPVHLRHIEGTRGMSEP